MLLKIQSFIIDEFQFPAFNLNKGEMIRFWVQIGSNSKGEMNGFWGKNKMEETLNQLNFNKKSIKICSNNIKRNFVDFIKPRTVYKYLVKEFGYPKQQILELISQFEIKPEYILKNLGTGHQKILSILCEFQRKEIVAFDYYGLSPYTTEQLTKFVKNELKKGKSAISFDNLYYLPKNPDSEMIVNLEIRRTSKIN